MEDMHIKYKVHSPKAHESSAFCLINCTEYQFQVYQGESLRIFPGMCMHVTGRRVFIFAVPYIKFFSYKHQCNYKVHAGKKNLKKLFQAGHNYQETLITISKLTFKHHIPRL